VSLGVAPCEVKQLDRTLEGALCGLMSVPDGSQLAPPEVVMTIKVKRIADDPMAGGNRGATGPARPLAAAAGAYRLGTL